MTFIKTEPKKTEAVATAQLKPALPKPILGEAIKRYGGIHLTYPKVPPFSEHLLPKTTLTYDMGSVLKKWRYIYSRYFRVDGDGAVVSTSLTCNALITEPITCTNITPVDDAANDLADVWGGKRFRNLGLSLYLLLGKIAALPAAGATLRGKTVRVEGAAGVADVVYVCVKNADDTYSWAQVASGT